MLYDCHTYVLKQFITLLSPFTVLFLPCRAKKVLSNNSKFIKISFFVSKHFFYCCSSAVVTILPPPLPSPHPSPLPTLNPTLLWLCPCVLYACFLTTLPLPRPHYPLPTTLWLLSVCSLFQYCPLPTAHCPLPSGYILLACLFC